MGYIVMQTDFGSVPSSMVGVCKLVDPNLQIFPLVQDVPKFNKHVAGDNMADVIPFWPAGTVFVSVIDPGVGTERRACTAKTANGCYIVTPDNGCLQVIAEKVGITEIREIDQSVNRYRGNAWSDKSDIFHGRDIFAYTAARLAAGVIDFEGVGPAYPVAEMVTLDD